MAKFKGLIETKRKVSQTINLEELLGVDFTGQSGLRNAIAQAVIDFVVERTEGGDDNTWTPFKSYSEKYKESAEFELAGKSDREINLTLTGNMLSAIDVLSEGRSTIEIGIRGDEAPKAYNHQVGDTVPKRAFLGVSMDDLSDLIEQEFGSEIDELRQLRDEGESAPREGQSVRDVLSLLDSFREDSSPVSMAFFTTAGDIIRGG